VSDQREDEAMENRIGARQKHRGEKPHADVFGLMLERGRSRWLAIDLRKDRAKENQLCGQPNTVMRKE
jgi:hypothetical protein